MFSKAVVQAVLLFELETWVLTPCTVRALGSFQHGVARRIMGRELKRREEEGCEYPPMVAAMEEAGFENIGEYILKSHNMVAQYISTWPIFDLCEETMRGPGGWVAWGW